MRLSYTLHQDEYTSGVEAILTSIMATDQHKRWNENINHIIILYCVFFLAVLIISVLLFPESRINLLVFAAIIVLAQETARWTINRVTKKAYGSTYHPHRHSDLEVNFGDTTVECFGPGHKHEWDWPLLKQLHDTPKVYVLEFVGYDMLVIPKRVWSSPEQEKTWLEHVRQHFNPEL